MGGMRLRTEGLTAICWDSPRTKANEGVLLLRTGAYQRISLSITHWQLLAGGALAGHAVAVQAHVLGPQLQQRGPLVLLGAGCPGVAVHHPPGRVLPGRPPPVQLQEHKATSGIPTAQPLPTCPTRTCRASRAAGNTWQARLNGRGSLP